MCIAAEDQAGGRDGPVSNASPFCAPKTHGGGIGEGGVPQCWPMIRNKRKSASWPSEDEQWPPGHLVCM